jgi:mRNA interferase MazF
MSRPLMWTVLCSLLTLVPHTTSLRESRFEVAFSVPFLRSGAFDAQNLVTVAQC